MKYYINIKIIVSALAMIVLMITSSITLAETIFISDQLRPIEEAQKVRNVILKNSPDKVNFVPEEGPVLVTKIIAEQQAGKGSVHVIGSLHGTFPVLDEANALSDVGGLMAKLKNRGFSGYFCQPCKNRRFFTKVHSLDASHLYNGCE